MAITPKIGGLILTQRSEHKNKIFTASLVAAFALADPAAAEEEAQQDKTAVVTWTFKVEDKPTFGTNQSKWNTTKVPDRKGCVGGRWRTATPAERPAHLACADPPAPPALLRSVLGMVIVGHLLSRQCELRWRQGTATVCVPANKTGRLVF